MKLPIKNRSEAGQALARELAHYRGRDNMLVLALPRGGVPVACEIASKLQVPVDLMLVRKLGTPGQEELAMGAIASGGIQVLNQDIVSSLGISTALIADVAAREQQELQRREQAYRGDRPRPQIEGRDIILVDDGVATGATMRAAIAAIRKLQPAAIIIAVPVAPADTVAALRLVADEVVCLAMPEPFMAIGSWYRDFSQVSDQEVQMMLKRAWDEE